MTNIYMSQNINTKNIKCIDESKLNEIYLGLKQGDYLKMRLKKTEETLVSADELIKNQKNEITGLNESLKDKDIIIGSNLLMYKEELEHKNTLIKNLNISIDNNNIITKKTGRKKFWKGLGLGIISGAVITTTTLMLIK